MQAVAALVPDAAGDPPPNQLYALNFDPGARRAQTFTVQNTGVLKYFEVRLGERWSFDPGGAVFEIWSTSAGLPSARLTTAVLQGGEVAANIATWVGADVDLGVTEGDVLALLVETRPEYAFSWSNGFLADFTGGQAYFATAAAPMSFTPRSTVLAFRTYVEVPASVPEPSGIALALLALGALRMTGRPRVVASAS
jgi:hypothetical protein